MLMCTNDVVYEGKWFFNLSASLRSSQRTSRVRPSAPRFGSCPAPVIEIATVGNCSCASLRNATHPRKEDQAVPLPTTKLKLKLLPLIGWNQHGWISDGTRNVEITSAPREEPSALLAPPVELSPHPAEASSEPQLF